MVPVEQSVPGVRAQVGGVQEASETGVWMQPAAVSHPASVTPAVPQVTGVQVPFAPVQVAEVVAVATEQMPSVPVPVQVSVTTAGSGAV